MIIYAVKMIADRLNSVRQRIIRCCDKTGRDISSVRLICVTKGVDPLRIAEAVNSGVTEIGENRVQEMLLKFGAIGNTVKWHMIGHLQSNKVKDILPFVSLIHSLDSKELAEDINKRAATISKIQEVLVQLNVSGERSKHGITVSQLPDLLNRVSFLKNIKVKGLMTMAPETDNPEDARPHFMALRRVFEDIKAAHYANIEMEHLSMGMSNDFEVAVEEGSTMVRIGRTIFA